MIGSDNVCFRNQIKDLRDFNSVIKSPKPLGLCAGENSDSVARSRDGRAPCVGLRCGGTRSHTAVDKFWARVQKTDGCWLFAGAPCNRAGHKHLLVSRGQRAYAHRFSYELHHGPIPGGMVVMHSCDVPACVNPAHLSIGTQRDNVRDSVAKGRWRPQRHARTLTATALVTEGGKL